MTFKQIREGRLSKVISSYLAIQMLIQFTGGNQIFALTSGPSQPEFNSFTPIGTSDMVSLTTGDFSYNLPLLDVGGYPINLSYDSGITTDQESSWVDADLLSSSNTSTVIAQLKLTSSKHEPDPF